ncbi:hypothetical protein POL68_25760 [Stigmatella sp. ncwal1]|uniref:Uncharacterized protein n=1 Tax=Stigmatella ashevillensis TaxID=2995309 RepID=A0ABT5DDZ0_9BACT|nr:hypothetical protein [Stigmatella ashevillena]MDC0711900.1 hypothetical protein [Stigmatella ashevillena]
MALIDRVKTLCDRLASHGWAERLRPFGLELTAASAAALATQLARPVRRPAGAALAGFEDFAFTSAAGIQPSAPGKSLLYHALASPYVHPTPDNAPAPTPEAYPTIEELDTVENYLYSVAKKRLADFPGAVLAVFAYQYRSGERSPHGLHADMAFSRTGVARVGTRPPRYDAARRSFWVEPEDGGNGLAVLPARYAAFLCVSSRPGTRRAVLAPQQGDTQRTFLFPVHKLFAGDECLVGETLTEAGLDFDEYHRNEKLRRVHTHGRIPALPGFDLNRAPFVRESGGTDALVGRQRVGASVLLVPLHHPTLVRTVTQTVAGREELVRFAVPRKQRLSFGTGSRETRFWTTFDTIAGGPQGRRAPEYVNIRHRVTRGPGSTFVVEDVNGPLANGRFLAEADFLALVDRGGYEAAHFTDDTCDGCVSVRVSGLSRALGTPRPAYSLVTAPDFFPLADQADIAAWVETLPDGHFRQGGPKPLSQGRDSVNPDLPRPGQPDVKAFVRSDKGMTAVVGAGAVGSAQADERPPVSVTWLPDGASGVFAPGWDVALGNDDVGSFTASFGLGSPFPEDAKLCAALNSFWPAVAPDASRTFNEAPMGQPLLDAELGYHPEHPRVKAGEVVSAPGWDGEHGPFLVQEGNRRFMNFANRFRADYVSQALAGRLRLGPLAQVTSQELIARMEALRFCLLRVLPPAGDTVPNSTLVVVTLEPVVDWGSRPFRDTALSGGGYYFVFVDTAGQEEALAGTSRRRVEVLKRWTCHVSQTAVRVQEDDGPFTRVARPPGVV